MAKRLWFLLLALGLLAGGCAEREAPPPQPEPAAEEQPALGAYEFRLNALPELTAFQPFSEISTRYYPAYTDHLLPRDDYGPLYPFIGRIAGYSAQDYGSQAYYGLCDSAGRIVVDPVYTDCYTWRDEYGTALYVLAGRAVLYQPDADQAEHIDYYSPNTIAPLDGSWVIPDVAGYVYAADSQAVIISGMYLDWNEPHVTNYIYTPDGRLCATLPDSTLQAYGNGRLLIEEPGPDGEPRARLVDLDGRTVEATEQEAAALEKGGFAALDENGLWGLTDEQGRFIDDQRYARLERYYEDSGLTNFTSVDEAMCGLLDSQGRVMFQMPQNSGWFNLYIDKYTGEKVLAVYDSAHNSRYLQNLDSGETSETLSDDGHWLDYLGNGWYYDIRSDHRLAEKSLALTKWGGEEPAYVLKGAESVYLDGPDRDIAVVTYYDWSEKEPELQASVAFFRLSDGREISRLNGYEYAGYVEGLGYTLYDRQDWQQIAVDEQGQKLLPDAYYRIFPVGDGWFSVFNDIYAGLINARGEWLIRFRVNNLD